MGVCFSFCRLLVKEEVLCFNIFVSFFYIGNDMEKKMYATWIELQVWISMDGLKRG